MNCLNYFKGIGKRISFLWGKSSLVKNPLHQAILDNNWEALPSLLKRGCDPHEPNRYGQSAIQLAHFLGRSHCLEVIGAHHLRKILFCKRGEQHAKRISRDELKLVTGVDFGSHLLFKSPLVLEEVCALTLRVIASKALSKRDYELSELHKDWIHEGKSAAIEIHWISERIGYGAFAGEDFQAGTYITEYNGCLLAYNRALFNTYCFEYPAYGWNHPLFMVDAEKYGGYARYINHSTDGNLEPLALLADGILHIILIAKKPIQKGDQLLYDYGAEYWRTKLAPDPLFANKAL